MDYSKYLSIDNGHGLLLRRDDVLVLERYKIDYFGVSSIKDLIIMIEKCIDDNYGEDFLELEEVIDNLMEMHYYNEVNK